MARVFPHSYPFRAATQEMASQKSSLGARAISALLAPRRRLFFSRRVPKDLLHGIHFFLHRPSILLANLGRAKWDFALRDDAVAELYWGYKSART